MNKYTYHVSINLWRLQNPISALSGSPPESRRQWGFVKACIRRAQALAGRTDLIFLQSQLDNEYCQKCNIWAHGDAFADLMLSVTLTTHFYAHYNWYW